MLYFHSYVKSLSKVLLAQSDDKNQTGGKKLSFLIGFNLLHA